MFHKLCKVYLLATVPPLNALHKTFAHCFFYLCMLAVHKCAKLISCTSLHFLLVTHMAKNPDFVHFKSKSTWHRLDILHNNITEDYLSVIFCFSPTLNT